MVTGNPAGILLLSLAAAATCAADSRVTACVAEAEVRAEQLVRTYPGRVVPVALANVRAQVAGEILEVCFSNGSAVAAGQPLYRIDAVKYEAAVRNAEAKVPLSQFIQTLLRCAHTLCYNISGKGKLSTHYGKTEESRWRLASR